MQKSMVFLLWMKKLSQIHIYKGEKMENYPTEESVELLLDEIIDAVESNSTREMRFEEIRNILVSQGIIVTDREKENKH